ncbi:hypothetical protein ASD39_25275 [Sphingomonas sp. Root50]|nr:hypothetical protein ASD17_24760 [Sphingomonas sp. Root1294]KQY69656.1 hypothetical protein ASD39_25275 [Sphingomonas sp. Root50]KRB93471.1 hypothetical protein ASE22_25535 [Sphingomonas sp. Root720]
MGWIDDEDRSDGYRWITVGMNHAVELRNLAIGIGNHRKIKFGTLCFLNIAFPLVMGFDRINRQTNGFNIALVPFGTQFGDFAKFGCADRGEILGMAEEDAPFIP